MTQCASCSKELVPNAKFCKFCGATQVAKSQADTETPVLTKLHSVQACKKCGNELIPNAKFCKHCGTNVENTSASNSALQPTPINALNSQQSQQESLVVNAPKPIATKSNTTKYSVIAILLTILIGGVGYWGWSNKKVAEEQSALIAKQQAEAEAQKIAAEAEKNERTKLELLGVDLKLAIEKIIPDESETYAVPDPITVTKAFKPCKFEGGDGKFQTDCKLSTSGNLLVEENVKDDRNVRIRTIGARTTVDMISFEATFPNNIQNAFSEIADWNIKEIECGQEKDLERLTIYTAKPNGKREFVFKTTVSYGSGGNWGNLTIHLTPIKDNKPCSLVELNTVNQEVSDTQNVSEPPVEVVTSNTNSTEDNGRNNSAYNGSTPLSCNATVDCNSQADVIAKMTKRWIAYSTKTHYGNICFEAITRVKGIPAQVWSAGLATNQMEVCNMQ
jgi:hypothetical protein